MRADEPDHGHQAVPSDLALRVKALESLLVEKGLFFEPSPDEQELIPTVRESLVRLWPYQYPQRSLGVTHRTQARCDDVTNAEPAVSC
jgi:hypothetical protein